MEDFSDPNTASDANADDLPDWIAVENLLDEAGLSKQFKLQRLSGGRNNRVYRLETPTQSVLLKWYFGHRDDKRDRLGAEYAFCQFAWSCGIHDVPRPVACDAFEKLGIYEFIDGRQFTTEDVTPARVAAAADFVRRINQHRNASNASELPLASEACFSMREHLDRVERRVAALQRFDGDLPVHEEARQFANDQLFPAWNRISSTIERAAEQKQADLTCVLRPDERCLSPSDFGFHNALLNSAGDVRFIDLEYAGWDDPSRLICDFFCQVQVPVPRSCLADFSSAIVADMTDSSRHLFRAQLLLPLYRLKWCCIVLNEFLPIGQARRSFSATKDPSEYLARQLEKARGVLSQLAEDLAPLA